MTRRGVTHLEKKGKRYYYINVVLLILMET